ncbi:MAG: methyltransferase [Flavobacterium sp.]|nr:methyltransferase [Flavobacterium sp.]
MKVGTDGVLLGAWCPIDNNPKSILDIGTGTGVIALMLAQRTNAKQIDALEIDENAYVQATENFENSPFADRLFCYHAGLDEFIDDPEDEYDLIISNPPFFLEDFKSTDEARNLARFVDAMPFEMLIEAADLLLSENGIFAVIIPFKEEEKFIALANEYEMNLIKRTRVRGTLRTPIIRSLLAFKRFELPVLVVDELVIEIERHVYTDDYIDLVKDFYLKM